MARGIADMPEGELRGVKMRDKKRFCAIVVALLLTMSVVPGYAATTQEKISDAQTQKKSTESTLEDTKSKIAVLESKKNQSESYLSDLSQQLAELQASLEQLQSDYEVKQQELEQVQQELEEAKEQEFKQYEDMKLRIQYMYENSGSGYIDMLFSSENFGDFLSCAQNMAEINKYDRNMLDDYKTAKEQVQEKEEKVVAEQQKIASLQAESTEKQEQVQEIYQATYIQMREYTENLGSAQSEANSLLAQISVQEENITQLMVQAKNEEVERQQREAERKEAAQNAARRQSTADGSTTSQNNNGSSSGSGNAKSGNQKNNNTNNTAAAPSGNSSNTQASGTYLGRFKLTAYCNCKICTGKWAGGLTASGTTPTAGRTIAMAGLPFGTQLLINGQVYTVEDRGTQYGHVDVFTATHSQALSFGLQYADVYRLN